MFAGRVWWDDGLAASFSQPVPEPAGIIGAVGQKFPGRRHPRQQRLRAGQIVSLAGCQGEGDRASDRIGQGVNLGRPSAVRASDRLNEVPPFAPAAERCALMWVESTEVVLTTPLDPLKA